MNALGGPSLPLCPLICCCCVILFAALLTKAQIGSDNRKSELELLSDSRFQITALLPLFLPSPQPALPLGTLVNVALRERRPLSPASSSISFHSSDGIQFSFWSPFHSFRLLQRPSQLRHYSNNNILHVWRAATIRASPDRTRARTRSNVFFGNSSQSSITSVFTFAPCSFWSSGVSSASPL
jgi:hypothetical protein